MLKIGIIGTGGISAAHIKSYKLFSDKCEIVALCDIFPEKCQGKNKDFGLNAKIFNDHKDLLQEDLDLVSICTPPSCHKEIAVNTINAGINVIIEKPLAASLEECDKILDALKNNKVKASVISQNRFRNDAMKLKSILDSGLIGEIVSSTVNSYWWRGHCYYDLWWRGTWEKEGGGCTLNHAVHHIDIHNWLLNKMPKEITAFMSNISHDNSEVEDISMAVLKYPQTLSTITSSVIHHGEEQYLEFHGKVAKVSMPFTVKSSKSLENGHPTKNIELEERIQDYYNNVKDLEYEGHEAQILDVLNAINENKNPYISVQDGKNTLEIITAIYKSAATKKVVKLPIPPEDLWYTIEGIKKETTYFNEKTNSIDNFTSQDEYFY
ncbi:MAG: Gfo/Idh/MocA family protein [Lachnospirales bacterium]